MQNQFIVKSRSIIIIILNNRCIKCVYCIAKRNCATPYTGYDCASLCNINKWCKNSIYHKHVLRWTNTRSGSVWIQFVFQIFRISWLTLLLAHFIGTKQFCALFEKFGKYQHYRRVLSNNATHTAVDRLLFTHTFDRHCQCCWCVGKSNRTECEHRINRRIYTWNCSARVRQRIFNATETHTHTQFGGEQNTFLSVRFFRVWIMKEWSHLKAYTKLTLQSNN